MAFEQLGGSGIFVSANSNQNAVTNNTMTGLGKINVGSTGVHIEKAPIISSTATPSTGGPLGRRSLSADGSRSPATPSPTT